MENKQVVNGVYHHINNGGVAFCVTNEQGPTINVQASHFGNLTNHLQLHVSKEGLRKMGEMFIAASEYLGYSPDYVCAAETLMTNKDTGEVIKDEPSPIWTPQKGGDQNLKGNLLY